MKISKRHLTIISIIFCLVAFSANLGDFFYRLNYRGAAKYFYLVGHYFGYDYSSYRYAGSLWVDPEAESSEIERILSEINGYNDIGRIILYSIMAKDGRIDDAKEGLKHYCLGGNYGACLMVSQWFYSGKYGEVNMEESFELLNYAFKSGYINSSYSLARHYWLGEGITADAVKAISLLELCKDECSTYNDISKEALNAIDGLRCDGSVLLEDVDVWCKNHYRGALLRHPS